MELYSKVDRHTADLTGNRVDCGECNKCCCYPYLYMRLHKPEFDLIDDYIRLNKLPVRVHFESVSEKSADKRVFFRDWVCPLYSKSKGGCSVYPVRPFACRIYGAYKGEGCEIEGCAFENSITFKIADDIPIWKDYMNIISNYENRERGYIFPDSMLYEKPVIEFLMEKEYPWSFSCNYIKGWKMEKFYPMPVDQLPQGYLMKFGQFFEKKC